MCFFSALSVYFLQGPSLLKVNFFRNSLPLVIGENSTYQIKVDTELSCYIVKHVM